MIINILYSYWIWCSYWIWT